MTTRTKKRVAWALMCGGLGAAGAFLIVISQVGLPPSQELWIYFWPIGGIALGAAGFFWLRRLFCYEAPEPPATWTVSLTDLILGTLFSGACGAVAMALDREAQRAVPAFVLVGIVLYLQSALAASLEGIFILRRRVAFVVAHILMTLGCMSWFTLALALFAVTFLSPGALDFKVAWQVLQITLIGPPTNDMARIFRGCVYVLPVGIVLVGVMRRRAAA